VTRSFRLASPARSLCLASPARSLCLASPARSLLALALALAGCSEELGGRRDGGLSGDGGRADAPAIDGGATLDGGAAGDGGPGVDARSSPDARAACTSPPCDEMVRIAGGAAIIGCNSTVHCYPDEEPVRTITFSSFEIGRTEVTRAAYRECVRAGACTAPTDHAVDLDVDLEHPVYGVTWSQAVAYCSWRGMRLPTEAEWERAARGTGGRAYPWGDAVISCTYANYTPNLSGTPMACVGSTTPVGSYPAGASPEGALDMIGNVWEWTSTPYVETYYADITSTDPPDPPSGMGHSYRGCSYTSYDEFCDVWLRYYDDGSAADGRRRRGFRCVR
jgi:formylglycine-generating enzyme required for sulfatase activity